MRRDIFVFAGQSNMMGASVYPPRREIKAPHSYEYKHKAHRLGADSGEFVAAGYPVGEFSYADLAAAYSPNSVNKKGESTLVNYDESTYFCPSMSNLRSDSEKTLFPFSSFSEADAQNGVTLAPLLAMRWEELGFSSAYAHISKGGVSVAHYFTDEMNEEYARRISAYNETHGTDYSPSSRSSGGAADYFFEKCRDMFADAEARFEGDELASRCFFWLQGESDASRSSVQYETRLDILWDRLRAIGFSHFFCIRVDYFGNGRIVGVMRAQESFVSRHSDAYMLTRAASFLTYPDQVEDGWFITPPSDDYRDCRDSFFGFKNHHINEKGFELIAERAVKNLYRVLIEGKAPILEKENIRALSKEIYNV